MTASTGAQQSDQSQLVAEAVDRRRNFAIISHPDAGKTTLTENCCCTEVRFSRPVR